jgi:hypothetical protein
MPITTSLFAFLAIELRAAASFNEYDWTQSGHCRPEHLGGAFLGIGLSRFFSSSLAPVSVVEKGAFAFR